MRRPIASSPLLSSPDGPCSGWLLARCHSPASLSHRAQHGHTAVIKIIARCHSLFDWRVVMYTCWKGRRDICNQPYHGVKVL